MNFLVLGQEGVVFQDSGPSDLASAPTRARPNRRTSDPQAHALRGRGGGREADGLLQQPLRDRRPSP